jgi:small subunit ribosomal protein S6e
MAKFKVIISDPGTGKSQLVEVEDVQAVPLVGRRLGEVVDGSMFKLSGHKLEITGGSDKDGFPMRPDVHGGVRIKVILSKGVGFHPSQKGDRRRKTLRGEVITEDIVQVNMKIVEKPKKKEKTKRKKKVKEEAEATEEPAQTT